VPRQKDQTMITDTTTVTYIVWGRGSVGAALRERNGEERLGACDDADYDQVADELVAAGVAERVRGGGIMMLSSADEPWCCVTIGAVDESDLDADPAVIGYQTAAPRVAVAS